MQASIKNWLAIFFSVGLTLLGKPQTFKVSATMKLALLGNKGTGV